MPDIPAASSQITSLSLERLHWRAAAAAVNCANCARNELQKRALISFGSKLSVHRGGRGGGATRRENRGRRADEGNVRPSSSPFPSFAETIGGGRERYIHFSSRLRWSSKYPGTRPEGDAQRQEYRDRKTVSCSKSRRGARASAEIASK